MRLFFLDPARQLFTLPTPTVENNWNTISSCNVERHSAACSVFQSQCVIIGGKNHRKKINKMKSIETYDHYLNKWLLLADMQTARIEAEAITKGNKLFVLGGFLEVKCEVYDSISKKFCYIEKFWDAYCCLLKPIIFDNFIAVYYNGIIYKYNIIKDKWSAKDYRDLNDELRYECSFIKVYKILK